MAFRVAPPAKTQSTTVAQPLIGSWITATSSPMGGLTSAPITLTLGTADDGPNTDARDFFQPGDEVMIINPNGANAEKCRIGSIPADSSDTIVLAPISSQYGNYYTTLVHPVGAFGTGAFISLSTPFNNFVVTYEDGASGQWLYLGNQYNMSATFHRFWKLAKVAANTQPFYYSATESYFGMPYNTSEIWVLGTATSDLYTVSLNII